MSTTILIEPPTALTVGDPPTVGEMLEEILPLIGVVAVAGPPAIILLGPLVLFALMLAGAFALAATLALAVVAARIAAGVIVALIGAIVAAPYLLAGRVRHHFHPRTGARQLVAVEPRHGVA
jgi:hypothetical protein